MDAIMANRMGARHSWRLPEPITFTHLLGFPLTIKSAPKGNVEVKYVDIRTQHLLIEGLSLHSAFRTLFVLMFTRIS